MSGLPQGWATAVLADLIASDGVFSDGDWVESKDQDPHGSIRLLQLADIGDGVFLDKSNRFINELKFDQLRCTEVLEGDVLVARMPDPLGRACLAPRLRQQCITVVDVAIVRPGHSSVQPAWLMRFLNAPEVRQEIEVQSSGTTRRRISRSNLAQLQLPVAPLKEQKHIADKLDAVLARVDACRERLDRVPGILMRFRQAVLAAATSGKLTEDWRERSPALENVSAECSARGSADQVSSVVDLPLPITWRWSKFGEFVSSFRSGTSGVPQDEPTNFPVLRSSSIRPGKVDLSDVRFLPPGAKFRQEDLLADGDLLFTRLSGSLDYVANCAMVHDLASRRVYYPDRLFRAKVIQPSSAPYFELCFSSPNLRRFLVVEAKSSAGHQRVSMGAVTGFPIPLPPPSEQHEIVRRVEALFAYADHIEARYTAARAQVERLTPALLAKAFRGELVPQDHNDEPASVLLERIRTVRAAAGETAGSKRRTGGARPKASQKAEVLMLTHKDVQDTHMTTTLPASSATRRRSSS